MTSNTNTVEGVVEILLTLYIWYIDLIIYDGYRLVECYRSDFVGCG